MQRAGRTGEDGAWSATTAVGVDWGATLAKIAVRRPGAAPEFRMLPCEAPDACARTLAILGEGSGPGAARVGVTGGGGALLMRELAGAIPVNEFAAWGAGAAALLAEAATEPAQRYLLVSLGTGTSVLLVDGLSVMRVGGTALGGGTLRGLAAGLIGTADFERIVELAGQGSRREVDLLVSDIYQAGGIPLAGDLTASNLGRLALRLGAGETVAPADIAHGLMGLLGENVALVCAGLAATAQVRRIVFGGSTLRGNQPLVAVLEAITRALGREPVFLPDGEYAGALGALLLAQTDAPS